MACDICEHIADSIGCQGCADDFIRDCEAGNCDGAQYLEAGSVNGHSIPPLVAKE